MNYYLLLKERAITKRDALFLAVDDETYSYGQFLSLVDELAAAHAGARGTCLIDTPDVVRQYALFFSYQKVGAIPLLLHPELPDTDRSALNLSASGPADCLAVLSSGSTGTPKVMYRTYDSWASFFPCQNEAFGISDGCRLFLHGSFSFTGNLNAALAILYAGGALVMSRHFRQGLWLSLIRKAAVQAIYLVPAKLAILTARPQESVPSVTSIFTGSQLVTVQLAQKLQQLFPQSAFFIYYGASEVNYISYLRCDGNDRDVTDLGKPFPGVQVTEKDGLLYIDSSWHISGLALPYTLQDRGYLDGQGHIHYEGRKSQWINKSGYKLSCAKVELLLKNITGIEDALVYPTTDELRGQDVGACVVASPGMATDALTQAIRKILPPIAVPAHLTWVRHIVLNDRGKPDLARTRQNIDQGL